MRNPILVALQTAAFVFAPLFFSFAFAQQAAVLRSSDGGEVRSLIIGIDAYQHVRPLKGAVADAQDIESALRRMGAQDIVTLVNAQVDRASVLLRV